MYLAKQAAGASAAWLPEPMCGDDNMLGSKQGIYIPKQAVVVEGSACQKSV
jgi:hypothetical protein